MSTVHTVSQIEFFESIPTSIIGDSGLVIAISGRMIIINNKPAFNTCLVDSFDKFPLCLGESIPGFSHIKADDKKKQWVNFSTFLTIPASKIGTTHKITIQSTDESQLPSNEYTVVRVRSLLQNYPSNTTIAICMAVYNPLKKVFIRQIQSIIEQDRSDWICIINDDGSDRQCVEMIKEIVSQDSRFIYFRNEKNLGFYGNFETALSRVPDSIQYIALADQDDYWYPNKLDALVDKLEDGNQLVYSDLRIVDKFGSKVTDSYWGYRLNEYEDLKLILVANTITGAACMFHSNLLMRLLPFPTKIGDSFHDHWIACAALADGKIGYIDTPLYDYYQYGENVIGHCNFDNGATAKFPWRWYQLLNPVNIRNLTRRFIGSSLAIYWFECRRIALICDNLQLRGITDVQHALPLFSGGMTSVFRLFWLHFKVKEIKRITNHAELRLARAYLVYNTSRLKERLGVWLKFRFH